MIDVNDEAALRKELVAQYRRVGELKLNEMSSGNISCRFGDGMLISPTGAEAETITEDMVVYLSKDGEWKGDYPPSSEWAMHAAVYRDYPRARAVVHTHSDHVVAVSCLHKPLPGFHYLVGVFGGGDVPCVPYHTFGTMDLGEAAAAALKDRTACLLGSHGMLCRAGSLNSAVNLAHRLEIMCRQYIIARQLGEPYHMTDAEWVDFFARAKKGGYVPAPPATADA